MGELPRGVGLWLSRHWLGAGNAVMLVFAGLPVLSPLLAAAGWREPASAIFARYALVCHQLPSRTFFLFGQPMAYCERNTAIYGSLAVGGLLWARFGKHVSRLPFWAYLLLITPMALDGFTQLFGWRESTWELRVITGTLFGVASLWLALPVVGDYMGLLALLLRGRERTVAGAQRHVSVG